MQLKTRSLISDAFAKMSYQSGFTAILIYVFQGHSKTFDLGIISISMLLPSLIFMYFSKEIIFKLNPLRSYLVSIMLRSSVFLVLPLFNKELLIIGAVAAISSLLQQIGNSAKLTFDSFIVNNEERTKFNAKKSFLGSLSVIIGPTMVGVISGFAGAHWGLLFTSVLGFISSLFLVKGNNNIVKKISYKNEERREYPIKESKINVLKWIVGRRDLLVLVVIYTIVISILEMEAPLVFPFVKEVYGNSGDMGGALLGVCGIGSLICSLIMHKMNKLLSSVFLSILLTFDGLILYLTTLGQSVFILYVLFGLLGIISSATLITVETRIQNDTPKEHQPLIFSIITFASGAGGATLTLISTSLADFLGTVNVLQYCAIFEIILSVVATLLLLQMVVAKKTVSGGENRDQRVTNEQ